MRQDENETRKSISRYITGKLERRARGVVHHDSTRLVLPAEPTTDIDDPPDTGEDRFCINFDMLERIDRNLRGEVDDLDGGVLKSVRTRLVELSEIPSGKKGFAGFRHTMDRTTDATPIPNRLPTGSPTICAEMICVWFAKLEKIEPTALQWLVNKYAYSSEAEKGRFKLDNDDELSYLNSISPGKNIRIDVDGASIANSRRHTAAQKIQRGRIRCLDSDNRPMRRDHTAIVWVMQYLFAALTRA